MMAQGERARVVAKATSWELNSGVLYIDGMDPVVEPSLLFSEVCISRKLESEVGPRN